METLKLTVANVKCGGCVSNIQQGLSTINGIDNVDVEINGGVVTISGEQLNQSQISEKLQSLGYPVSSA